MSYLLFDKKYKEETVSPIVKTKIGEFKIQIHDLKLFKGLYISGENKNIKKSLLRMMFSLISMGKAKIFYCKNNKGEIIHTSLVVPKCWKFPFLDKDDYEIGPCITNEQYRGNGIYPQILNYIVHSHGNKNTKFYMFVAKDNIPSIHGIEKAGFIRCGEANVTKLKQYRRI